HRATLTIDGPASAESAEVNPFTDYRLTVTFARGERSYAVNGYYAADGNAGETGAAKGNKWRAHFAPDEAGRWTYKVSFRTGKGLALASAGDAPGRKLPADGLTGSFTVAAADPKAPGFRGKGMLRYVGRHYLQFAGSKQYYIKGGADSPENFLGYWEFDGTKDTGGLKTPGLVDGLHRYAGHVKHWKPGDPTWRGGKGKNIIGALNYLASKGMNSVYFLTMNVRGDGKDVWPWTGPEQRSRFDCSKLDQWEIVFSHMDTLGIALHVVTQETENDRLLDRGRLGRQRKLYYRELIARFGHHLALVWNLGEENNNTTAQLKAFTRYIRRLDPYDHPLVVHTGPSRRGRVYTPLLGYEHFDGPSMQLSRPHETHAETLKWVQRSAEAKRPWFVCLDEFGPANSGAVPDKDDPDHDSIRKQALWANLMAGGAGVEWYFGYRHAHNDLNCEDWRSRERLWDQTRWALEFFARLPVAEMIPADGLASARGAYCLAKVGQVYAVYLPDGGTTELKLPAGNYAVKWYNPRAGGRMLTGTIKTVRGGGSKAIGLPPGSKAKDWAVLIGRTDAP
ncbi:hypothetical protein LCGC14_2021380, partial [marine sediment metagenome]